MVQERKKNLSIILYRLWPESTQGNKWLTHMVMFTQSSRDPTKSLLDDKGNREMWNWKQSTMPKSEILSTEIKLTVLCLKSKISCPVKSLYGFSIQRNLFHIFWNILSPVISMANRTWEVFNTNTNGNFDRTQWWNVFSHICLLALVQKWSETEQPFLQKALPSPKR